MSRSRSKILSFTLIELLIVIVIIGILATALITKVKNIQAKSRDTARIAHMRQMQQAMELYYNDYGKYPGGKHYASTLDPLCRHAHPSMNASIWTSIFDENFQSKYMSLLPEDPKASDPTFCYGYSGPHNTSTRCTKKDGTIIDIDGVNASGNVTSTVGGYVFTFKAESDLREKYPRWLGISNLYCIFEPGR